MPKLHLSLPWRARKAQGQALIGALASLSLLGVFVTMAWPSVNALRSRWPVLQARAAFERDWRSLRWRAQQWGQSLRLQPVTPCVTPSGSGGWHCGWQALNEANGAVLHQTLLPPGLRLTSKPNEPWRVDAWGEPLSGGASMLFESAWAPMTPELLCMNVLGRMRRLQGTTCTS
jgi:hypothetical protein